MKEFLLETKWNDKVDGGERKIILTADIETGNVVGVKFYGKAKDFKRKQ